MSLMSLCEKQSGSFSKPSRTLRHSANILHTVYWTSVHLYSWMDGAVFYVPTNTV